MIQISRKIAAIGAQSVVNFLLAVSLLNEYFHNRFMQDYLASSFSSMSLILPIGIVAAVAVAGGSYTIYSRRTHDSMTHESLQQPTEESPAQEKKLPAVATCTFCNIPLKRISENRFQCKNCQRYFKKKVR